MATRQFDNAEAILTSALSSAGTAAFASSSDSWATASNNPYNTLQFAQIYDDGVTQSDPEIILVSGSSGSTILNITQRGMFNTDIPTNWPIGSVISTLNHAHLFDAASAQYNGYPIFSRGWLASAAADPSGNALRFHAGADPEASTSMVINDVIDDSSGGWDLSPLLGELEEGDLVRIKFIYTGAYMGPGPNTTAADVDYTPNYRIEFKIGTGGPTDNTGWWTIPIDSGYFHVHGNMANTTDGWSGYAILDFMKLV